MRLIRYYENGSWKYATVKSVGDLNKLKTTAKEDLVSAINELYSTGGGGSISPELIEKIAGIERGLGEQQEAIDGIIYEIDMTDEHIVAMQELQNEINQKAEELLARANANDILIEDIIADLLNKVDAEYVDGKLTSKLDESVYKEQYEQIKGDLLSKVDDEKYREEYNAVVEEIRKKVDDLDFNKLTGRFDVVEKTVTDLEDEVGTKISKTEFDDAVGVDQWVSSRYKIDGVDLNQTPPSFSLIKGKQAVEVKDIPDSNLLEISDEPSHITHLFTNVYMNSARTIGLEVIYDDSMAFYMNGAKIYENKYNGMAKSPVSLSLRSGWNTLEILHGQATGEPVLNIGIKLSDQVDKMTTTIGVGDKNETRLTQAETEITQNSEAIKLKAEKTVVEAMGNQISEQESALEILSDEIKSTVKDTEFSEYTKRLETAESEISQTSEAIKQKVDKTTHDALNNIVEHQGTRIDQMADEIILKVSSEEFNGLKDRVVDSEAQIELNKESIGLKASQTELDQVEERLTTAEGEISVTKDQIKLRVTNDEFKTLESDYRKRNAELDITLDSITSRVGNTEESFNELSGEMASTKRQLTEVQQTAEGITQKVSSIEADFEGMEVGVRNIAPLTGLEFVRYDLTVVNDYGEIVNDRTLKIKANPPTGTAALFGFASVSIGGQYIINADISDTISSVVGVVVYDENKNLLEEQGLLSGDISWVDTYRGYQVQSDNTIPLPLKFKVEDNRVKYVRLRLGIYRGQLVTRDVLIKYPKLEKGSMATDWTPALEDTELALEELGGRISSAETAIEQTSKDIKLKANASDVDSLTKRVAKAEGELKVAKDEINARVTKAEFDDLDIGVRNYAFKTDKVLTNNALVEYEINREELEKLTGKKVTVSFLAKANNGTHIIDVYLRELKNGTGLVINPSSKKYTLSDEYQFIVYTFVMPDIKSKEIVSLGIRGNKTVDPNNDGKTFSVKNVKLEKGEKATAYTQAPEDINENIENSINRNRPLNVRYIRDWLNGSSANTGNHWIEIAAYRSGKNVALNKSVTSSATITNASRITDGIIGTTSNHYAQGGTGLTYVQVDLGSVYGDLEFITVHHYYSDGRIYNDTKTEVSEDGKNWVVLFDSEISGKYAETVDGRVYTVNSGYAVSSNNKRLTSAELKITDDAITSTVTSSQPWKTQASQITQTAGKVEIVVGSDNKIKGSAVASAITADPSAINLISDNINLTGKVTFTSLDSNTQSIINGKETPSGAQAKANAAKNDAIQYVDDNTGNLLNNTSVSGNTKKWSGTGLSVVNKDFFGATIPVQQVHSNANAQITSEFFTVDPSKAYEVTIWLMASATTGTDYFGLHGYKDNTAIGIIMINNSSGADSITPNTNPYFWSGSNPVNKWIKRTAYIMPAGTSASDMKGIGENVGSNARMIAGTNKIRIRYLNYYNDGTYKYLWMANPKVVEVDPNAVIRGTSAKDTVDSNKGTWDRSSNINSNGTFNASKLSGTVSESQINTSATSKWNAASTDISRWKMTGKTTINGGQIETDTISVAALKAGMINADKFAISNSKVTIDKSGVTVRDADFLIEDAVTGLKSSAVFRPNLINDHSFESLGADLSKGYNNFTSVDAVQTSWNSYQWSLNNKPRLAYITKGTERKYGMFGFNHLIVNSSNYASQYVLVGAKETYTVSLHARKAWGYAAGSAKIRIRYYKADYTEISPFTDFNFPTNTSEIRDARYSGTFTTPAGTEVIRLYFYAQDSNWVMIDGVQLVSGSVPAPYNPEDGLSQFVNGAFNANVINVNGEPFINEFETGYVSVPGGSNSVSSVSVNFSRKFSKAPIVFVNPRTTVIGTIVKGAAAGGASTTGFTVYLLRTNSTNTGVNWLAINL